MKNVPIITIPLIVLLILGGVIVWNESTSPLPSLTTTGSPGSGSVSSTSTPTQIADWKCLGEGEYAEVVNDKKESVGEITIVVKNEDTDKIEYSFGVSNAAKRKHPPEIHKCGVYLLKSFGFDYATGQALPGYKNEIISYDYDGQERMAIQLSGENSQGKPEVYYSSDFRVSPDEKYITLVRGYEGKDDYAMIFKDIDTLKDIFILPYSEVQKKSPGVIGSFGLGKWIDNGNIFFADLFDGAWSSAFVKVYRDTWEYEVLPTPGNYIAGVENRVSPMIQYFAYTDIPTFTGDQYMTDQILKEAQEKGYQKHLYIADLYKQTVIEIDSVPPERHRFNMQWLSDTKLQYELPDGTKRTYEVQT